MKVLSLFDGMSCGQLALRKAGLFVDQYYASEVDKFAIKITQKNFPRTIQLGDVQQIKASDLPKIDLLLGGSPCQGFSLAGRQKAFEDPRSALFWHFVRLLKEVQPKYFLLENVKMRQDHVEVISDALGVEPVEINSSLVSAQNRRRLYWTNIPFDMPADRGLVLADILEEEGQGVIRSYGKIVPRNEKSMCIDANYHKGPDNHGQRTMICVGNAEELDHYNNDQIKRVYNSNGISPTLLVNQGGNREIKITQDNVKWRKLSPVECERLQTVPDDYTAGVSNTQRYKMLGNGWTVDVVAHILRGIKDEQR